MGILTNIISVSVFSLIIFVMLKMWKFRKTEYEKMNKREACSYLLNLLIVEDVIILLLCLKGFL